MSWLLFTIAAWFILGLELALRDLLQIGPAGIAPSFVLPLMVFVALWAPARVAVGAAFCLGLLVDLTGPILIDGTTQAIAGPHALGYMLGAALVINTRGSVMRRNPVTLIVMTILAGIASTIVVVFLHSIRDFYDPFAWKPSSELVVGLASSLYSAATAALLSVVLFAMLPLFGFPAGNPHGGRASVHRA